MVGVSYLEMTNLDQFYIAENIIKQYQIYKVTDIVCKTRYILFLIRIRF